MVVHRMLLLITMIKTLKEVVLLLVITIGMMIGLCLVVASAQDIHPLPNRAFSILVAANCNQIPLMIFGSGLFVIGVIHLVWLDGKRVMGLVALCASTAIIWSPPLSASSETQDEIVKSIMEFMQFCAEQYAELHGGIYPPRLDGEHYISKNPFTRQAESLILGKITSVAESRGSEPGPLDPGVVEYSSLGQGKSYAIRGGGHDGRALLGLKRGKSTLVLSTDQVMMPTKHMLESNDQRYDRTLFSGAGITDPPVSNVQRVVATAGILLNWGTCLVSLQLLLGAIFALFVKRWQIAALLIAVSIVVRHSCFMLSGFHYYDLSSIQCIHHALQIWISNFPYCSGLAANFGSVKGMEAILFVQELVVLSVLLTAYFLPSIIAFKRKKDDRSQLLLMNIVLGLIPVM